MAILTKWHRPAGIELTRICPWEEAAAIPKKIKKEAKRLYPHDESEQEDYIENNWKDLFATHKIASIIDAGESWAMDKEHLINNFGCDPYCIEVSSAILRDWARCKQFFTETHAFLRKFKLLAFSDEICGTGGHIHVGIKDAREALKVKRLMLNHPEAMFAFCHPCDDHHPLENIYKNDVYYLYTAEVAEDGRRCPIAYRQFHTTVEFRMFDVAQTWEMQEEHMAFAQAFVEYAMTHPQKTLLYRDDINRRTFKEHAANFEKLIRMLKLPWNRYEGYLDPMEYRLKWETANFKW